MARHLRKEATLIMNWILKIQFIHIFEKQNLTKRLIQLNSMNSIAISHLMHLEANLDSIWHVRINDHFAIELAKREFPRKTALVIGYCVLFKRSDDLGPLCLKKYNGTTMSFDRGVFNEPRCIATMGQDVKSGHIFELPFKGNIFFFRTQTPICKMMKTSKAE